MFKKRKKDSDEAVQIEPKHEKPKKHVKPILFVDAIVVIFVVLLLFFMTQPEAVQPATKPFIELLNFSALYDNQTMNVELWLDNIGEQDALQLNVYVRCRNQNGTVLYEGKPVLTAPFLRNDESCSGTYKFLLNNSTKIYHTIEIQWVDGRHSYFETTIIE